MNFYKPILLPSNGVPYDSLIHIKEPTISLLLYSRSNFLSNSESDLILSVLKKFTSIEKPEELYYKDVQYIWFYFVNLLNNSNELNIPYTCYNCNNSLSLKVNMSELNLNYASKDNFKNRIIKYNDFTFEFRNRLFKDNIITGINNISNDNNVESIKNFLYPQCIKIIHESNEYDNDAFGDALLEIGSDNSLLLFDEIRKEDWGLQSHFVYRCKKCNLVDNVFISDPYRSSLYYSTDNDNKNEELLETLITISSFKMLSFNELLDLPLSLWEPTVNKINKIVKKKYGSKNSTGYFEHLQEEYD